MNTPIVISGTLKMLIGILIFWSLPWKGMALWRAAKQGSRGWFIVLFLVNTVAILDILYLFFFSKPDDSSQPKNPDVYVRKSMDGFSTESDTGTNTNGRVLMRV